MRIIKSEPTQPHFPDLTPIKSHIPKWYKETRPFKDDIENYGNATYKMCMPFMDAFTTGYAIPLPADIVVWQEGGLPQFDWGLNDAMEIRGLNYPLVEAPSGYVGLNLAWHTQVAIELPKGYSALITHPLNRYDLPFLTSSGIIDDFALNSGSVPFFIKQGFEGIIQQGTPIAQVIPFKREDWTHEVDKGLAARASINKGLSTSVVSGWYKKNIWKRKTFN